MGPLGRLLGASWGLLERLGSLVGACWELLGITLGASRGHLWHLEARRSFFKKCCFSFVFSILLASGEALGGLLGRSWGLLGASWGVLGLLGGFLGSLGEVLGALGSILGRLGVSWSLLGGFLGALGGYGAPDTHFCEGLGGPPGRWGTLAGLLDRIPCCASAVCRKAAIGACMTASITLAQG